VSPREIVFLFITETKYTFALKKFLAFAIFCLKQYNTNYSEFGGNMKRKFVKTNFIINTLLALSFLALSSTIFAASRNLIPRFPEIVIEKGFSENFLITDCRAKVRVQNNEADSTIKLDLKNRSNKELKSSIKFRILYPTSESQVHIKIDGQGFNYSRKSPRHDFTLKPQASLAIEISARTSVNYSIDSVREALRKDHEEQARTGKKFDLGNLMKLFDREKFGKRFMVGPIASKWGVFPLDFAKVNLEIIVPADFAIVAQNPDKWTSKQRNRETIYNFIDNQGFSGAVFLPENEKDEFIKAQEILTSSEFMH
jgi:hypothetical protein